MRIGRLGWFFLAVLALLAWHFAPRVLSVVAPSFIESVEDHGVYYRLLAKYQHGDEIVDFDIVVGCGVRVTRYGDGGSSYDAFRDPVVFAKALRDGSALVQIVPSACLGETTEDGRVPQDFLPGAIWFEHADDFSLGIAYVTEDAFESSRSVLRFLGASIHPATRADWEGFQPTSARNLMDPGPLFRLLPPPEKSEVISRLGDRKALASLWPGMSCHVVQRLQISDATRAIIRKYWPASKPRYWTLSEPQQMNIIREHVNLFGDADNNPSTKYLAMGHHTAIGFPTRARGGAIGSSHREWDMQPPTIFPMRRDEGIPWISADTLKAPALFRDVELRTDENRGLAYCYRTIPINGLRSDAVNEVSFVTRINGEKIYGEDADVRQQWERPWPFIERDQYLYFHSSFGLN